MPVLKELRLENTWVDVSLANFLALRAKNIIRLALHNCVVGDLDSSILPWNQFFDALRAADFK